MYDGVMSGPTGTKTLPPLPAEAGTYALLLRAEFARTIVVGRLGTLDVRRGWYVYVGSALGPGGLAARVGRHLRHAKTCRWHVDYLTAVATLDEVWLTLGGTRRECQWANALGQMRGATVPLDGFGASDCRCCTHLYYFRRRPSLRALCQRMTSSIRDHGSMCKRRTDKRQ